MEAQELDLFLRELCTSVSNIDSKTAEKVIPESLFEEFKLDIMDAYDENNDGRISVHELAEILPTEENFLLLFRLENLLVSTGDFMKVYKSWLFFYFLFFEFIEILKL